MFEILPLRAFSDNYIWTLIKDDEVTVVDPGDPSPVKEFLIDKPLTLKNILITHHHFDHTGGIEDLSKNFDCDVYGPEGDHINGITKTLSEGDQFQISNTTFHVLSTPGHTLDHLSFFTNDKQPLLFSGDTLFFGGCGRLFEGTPQQMFQSLSKFSELTPDTQVFCGHEYTESNLNFAAEVEPCNAELSNKLDEVRELRKKDKITLPSSIATELNVNPFMRCKEAGVIKAAQEYSQTNVSQGDEVLEVIRNWKDNF